MPSADDFAAHAAALRGDETMSETMSAAYRLGQMMTAIARLLGEVDEYLGHDPESFRRARLLEAADRCRTLIALEKPDDALERAAWAAVRR